MRKSKAVFKHFIRDDQFDLNLYLKYLINQMNPRSQNQYGNQIKDCKTKKIN